MNENESNQNTQDNVMKKFGCFIFLCNIISIILCGVFFGMPNNADKQGVISYLFAFGMGILFYFGVISVAKKLGYDIPKVYWVMLLANLGGIAFIIYKAM